MVRLFSVAGILAHRRPSPSNLVGDAVTWRVVAHIPVFPGLEKAQVARADPDWLIRVSVKIADTSEFTAWWRKENTSHDSLGGQQSPDLLGATK